MLNTSYFLCTNSTLATQIYSHESSMQQEI
jgi:hypothetical protein